MTDPLDLTGRTFGLLTAIELRSASEGYEARWLCQCVSGATVLVLTSDLLSGAVTSCGCINATGRTVLATALRRGLEPDMQIVSDARAVDSVKHPGACVLWTSRRIRQSLNGFEQIQDEVTLWVLTATDAPSKIEDSLDALLLDVLRVIESQNAFTWTEAERGVLADKFDGWRLTIQCISHIENND